MSKVLFTSFSQQELRNEFISAFQEVFGFEPNIKFSRKGIVNGIPHYHIEVGENKDLKIPKQEEPKEPYLTRGEVCRFLKISLPTLHRYTKDGILKSYRIVGKVRYKVQEVESALQERKFGLPKKGGNNE